LTSHKYALFLSQETQERKGNIMIKVGDSIPSLIVKHKTKDGIQAISLDQFCKGKKVILFGVPGAFTPTCTTQHVPGFLSHMDEFKSKSIDVIACISVNDPFVMDAWGSACQVGDQIVMLGDGNGEATKAMGLEMDLSVHNLGVRSQRYAMVIDNGMVTQLHIEKPGEYDVSSAEYVLEGL
jgi:peroxiredoxin